ncbi:hypothetical protein ACLOJK_003490 [Asimina triloba]
MGCGRMEQPLVLASQKLALGGSGLKRTYCSSGSLQHASSQQKEEPEFYDPGSDVSDDLSEEEDDTPNGNVEGQLEDGADAKFVKDPEKYVRIVSKQMVGIYLELGSWVTWETRALTAGSIFGPFSSLRGYPQDGSDLHVAALEVMSVVAQSLDLNYSIGRHVDLDLDLEEIMMTEAIWRSIQDDSWELLAAHVLEENPGLGSVFDADCVLVEILLLLV